MRGKSENPNLAKLKQVAAAFKADRDWLLHGLGTVEGEFPIIDDITPEEMFVAIPSVRVTASTVTVLNDGYEYSAVNLGNGNEANRMSVRTRLAESTGGPFSILKFAHGTSATWRGIRTKAAFSMEADIGAPDYQCRL